MNNIIDRVENIDRGAFVSENFWHQFWRKTFSAESFISPDPFVQDPDDPQNVNRYAYVLNGPQNYIDPSGYFWDYFFGGFSDFFSSFSQGSYQSRLETAQTNNQFLSNTLFGGDCNWCGGTSVQQLDLQKCAAGPCAQGDSFAQLGADAPSSGSAVSASNLVGGGLTGFGTGLLYAATHENLPTRTGQARLGGADPSMRYGWARSFHFDMPDKYNPHHFNAEIGPLKRFNHHPISPSFYRWGSTQALKTLGRASVAAGLALDVYDVATAVDRPRAISGVIGGWGGIAAGATIGSMIVPGVGTVVGGFIGGVAGSGAGQFFGDWYFSP